MSRKGHVPIRLCISCKKRKRKEEMLRFSLLADGSARVVEGKNRTGRGVYVCPDALCLKMAKKRRNLELPPVP
jgi:hypothetical protein